MAYDDMLFRGTISQGGSIVLNQIKGPSTIRAGYGQPRLISIRAFWHSTNDTDNPEIKIEYKNTNWTRSNKFWAGKFGSETAQARNTYNYVNCHNFGLLQNSAFIISATSVGGTIAGTCTVDVIVTVDYDQVPSLNPDNYAGCPITFSVTQAEGVTGSKGSQIRLGSYDVLDPGITYALNEVSTDNANLGMAYLVLEGIQTQRGLSRILPLPFGKTGIVPTILGSVQIVKQSFELSIISDIDITSQVVPLNLEMLASANSIGGQ